MSRRGIHATVLAALVGGLLMVTPAVTPAVAGSTAPPPAAGPSGTEHMVTLITGDRVTVAERGKRWELVDVEPARRLPNAGGYLRHVGPDGVTVIPTVAVPLVRSGQLDRKLFDVTGLVKLGYDDAHTNELPLLVESVTRGAAALGQVTRALPAAGVTAVAVPKNRAASIFDTVRGSSKIWLNGKVYPTLEQSVPQVGAPEAWAAGHTGAGATIAVLDTGYDANHPDLAGVVTGERDFVGEGMADQVGHGTHVAATAAGRGAASGGKYVGVAKGANLLVGKVCALDGCPFDAIIAGMQWAAASGARVVNMSLGGEPTDGIDPVSAEVNRLSVRHGTLFVIAAGNFGVPNSVSAPAAADSALAVASVTKQDAMSEFSSRGPRVGDFALKPDIAAPGEDIVAARAEGTLPDEAVDEHHARLSGTSMATPHVAGAAAILAAQHPDWTGERLKSALMSTAHPVTAGVYEQGTGRLDVARAVSQQVTTSPASLSLGYVQWPHDPPAPEPQKVTYRNTGTAPVMLDLNLTAWHESGQPAPAGMFRADATSVTVPAGGEAAVTVTFDPAAGPVGTYGGRLVATAGETAVQTTIGGYKEPERYDLTLNMIDRNGAAIPAASDAGIASVTNLDDPEFDFFPVFSNEPLRLPAGRYAVMADVRTPVDGQIVPSTTTISEPELTLNRNTTLDLDTRRGNPVTIQVDERDARLLGGVSVQSVRTDAVVSGLISNLSEDLYAVPTGKPREHFSYYNRALLEKPVVRLTVMAPESFEVPVGYVPNSPKITDSRDLTAVDVGHARPEEIAARDVRGKLAVFTLGAGEEAEFDARLRAIADAAAAAVLFYFSANTSITVREDPPLPAAYTLAPEGPRLARLAATGTPSVTLAGIAASPYRYELAFPHPGAIPSTVEYRPRNRDLATVRANYHAIVDGGVGYVDFRTRAGDLDMSGGISSTVLSLPVARTEYYSADPVTWHTSLRVAPTRNGGAEHGYLTGDRTYRRGERVTVNWNKAVIGPAITVPPETFNGPEPHAAYRDGDRITALLPLFSDSARHTGVTSPEEFGFADTGDTALYVDDTLVSRSGVPGAGTFEITPDAANYRLVADVTRNHPTWPLSTKVSAEWTLRSGHTTEVTPLPLLTVGFDPKLDPSNYAPAGKRFTFPVTVDRQPGASGGRPSLRTVEVSYDDGVTWQKARVHDRWKVTVEHPASGFVSLRATASDDDGNSVTQTVIRAYRLR